MDEDGLMDEWIDKLVSQWIDEWVDGYIEESTNRLMDGYIRDGYFSS